MGKPPGELSVRRLLSPLPPPSLCLCLRGTHPSPWGSAGVLASGAPGCALWEQGAEGQGALGDVQLSKAGGGMTGSHWLRDLGKAQEVSQFRRHRENAYLPTPSSCGDCCVWSLQRRLGVGQRPPLPGPRGVPSFSKDKLWSPLLQEAFPGGTNSNSCLPGPLIQCPSVIWKVWWPPDGWSSLRVGASSSLWAPAWSCRCSANACPWAGSRPELYFPKRFTEQGSGPFSHSLLNLHQPCSSVFLFFN